MIFTVSLSGCSTKVNVKTERVKEYKQDIQELSDDIKKVNVYFLRPNLFCQIITSEEPSDGLMQAILLQTKEFVTVENMSEVSNNVKWKSEISTVHLSIRTDDNEESEHKYFARYFKTFDASNKSDENVEAYQFWYEEGK